VKFPHTMFQEHEKTKPEKLLIRTFSAAIRHPSWILYYTIGSRSIFSIRRAANRFLGDLTDATEKTLNELWGDLASRKDLAKRLDLLKVYVITRKTDFYGFIPFAEIYYIICRLLEPDLVIETGVMHGISTTFILQALDDNGKGILYSIDAPRADYTSGGYFVHHRLPRNFQPGWIIPNTLRKRWKLVLGDSRQELPLLLSRLPKIDIFLHDSEHTYELMQFEYNKSWPRLKVGGLLLSDDVDRSAAFSEFLQRRAIGSHSTLLGKLGGVSKGNVQSIRRHRSVARYNGKSQSIDGPLSKS